MFGLFKSKEEKKKISGEKKKKLLEKTRYEIGKQIISISAAIESSKKAIKIVRKRLKSYDDGNVSWSELNSHDMLYHRINGMIAAGKALDSGITSLFSSEDLANYNFPEVEFVSKTEIDKMTNELRLIDKAIASTYDNYKKICDSNYLV